MNHTLIFLNSRTDSHHGIPAYTAVHNSAPQHNTYAPTAEDADARTIDILAIQGIAVQNTIATETDAIKAANVHQNVKTVLAAPWLPRAHIRSRSAEVLPITRETHARARVR